MTFRTLLGVGAAALTIAAAPAAAAEPDSGEVSPARTTATWSGTVLEPTGGYEVAAVEAGGTQGTCEAPSCDTFALKVGAGGERLDVKVGGSDEEIFSISFELEDPDGNVTVYSGGAAAEREASIEAPKAGDWVIRVFGTPQIEQFAYEGTATLVAAAAPTPPGGGGGGGGGGSNPSPNPPPADGGGPAPAPSPAPGSTAPPATSTAPLPRLVVGALRRADRSARRLRKGRRFAVALRTSAPLTRVVAVLVPASKRTAIVATGRTARLTARGSVRLRVTKAVKRGRYRLVVTGFDASGRRVTQQRTVTFRR